MRRFTFTGISSLFFLSASTFAMFSCSDSPVEQSGMLPGDSWREVFSPQDPIGLQHIVAIGVSFVGIGSDNKVYASDDGGNWRMIGLAAGSWVDINDLIWTGKLLIAVGVEDTSSRVYVSETGESWKQQNVPNARRLQSAASNGDTIVAVGYDWRALRKEADANWELVELSNNGNMWDVAWVGDRFVATHIRGILSSVDGKEWLPEDLDIALAGTPTVASSGNSVVAIGALGGVIKSEGTVWISIPFFSNWDYGPKVFWEGGRYVALGSEGKIAFSSDGTTWQEQRISFLFAGVDIAWNGSVYSLTGVFGTRMTAPDTVSWTVYSFLGRSRVGFRAVTFGDGEIVTLGGVSPIMKSSDGEHWTGSVAQFALQVNSLTWSGERYVAVGNGDTIYTSTDGVNWRANLLDANHRLNAVHVSEGRFVAVGRKSILYSEDGLVWETVFIDPGVAALRGIAKSDSLWLVVGGTGTILTSADGRIWARRQLGTAQWLIAADWTGKEFLVAGMSGVILRSADGFSWEILDQFSGNGFQIHDAVYANGRYVVVGTNGLVITSDNLVSWINRDLEPRTTIESITWDGRRLFAILKGSRIIVSE